MARRTANWTLKIDDRVLDILASFRCTGNVAHRHEETLAPKDYKALNEILEALGGEWNRKANGHLFPEGTDAAALLEAAMLTGSVKDPRVGDFFETPSALAERMVVRAGVRRGTSVLEPSAGHGAIASVAVRAGAHVVCVERDRDRQKKLIDQGFTVAVAGDFLAERKPEKPTYDVVLMNPPFSRELDVAHVTHALGFVRPGGKLVAITGPGWRFRQTNAAIAFRALMDERRADVEDLPEGTFRASGTMVRSCLVTIAA